ncbi:hypothetical protein ASPBRDRAFT_666697 [Aspergillus brasiliensis CBS 101740]|uniref:Arrestin-like N-terminal domain-containing protein n=1 Tax=Aspergillus brasiliensis (strain CBS 101740 / IMI 381727 / IBT 21946) TaxID=767769 RepID=A0A1L9U318_ASPBC|nr:hypothetical protein ASPBRDRAFT_666697 [Aspergillus brasiliensis CBS 101740]
MASQILTFSSRGALQTLPHPIFVPVDAYIHQFSCDLLKMNDPHLHLDSPRSHTIFIRPGIEPYTLPLSGSLRVSRDAFMDVTYCGPNITIKLSRTVNFNHRGPPCPNVKGRRRYGPTFRRSARKLSILPNYEETVLDCALWSASDILVPRENEVMAHSLVYYFDLPVPNCLPPTMNTDVGTVGYALQATIHLPSGRTLSTSKPLTISYRLISPEIALTYHRRFTGYPLTVETTITQQRPNDDTSKAMFSVDLVTRNLLTPGVRDGEMRHIVITAIKWRVDEVVVRINTACSEMQAFTSTNNPSTRTLIGGMLNFKPPKATIRTNQGLYRDDRFQVRFDIRIPESTNAADDVCQNYCTGDDRHGNCPLASSPGISVNHELKVEIMTEEDIFNKKTNKLLARKGIGRLYGSTYPLRIHKLADDVDDIYKHYLDEPLAFDTVRELLPPSYES